MHDPIVTLTDERGREIKVSRLHLRVIAEAAKHGLERDRKNPPEWMDLDLLRDRIATTDKLRKWTA